MYFEGVVVSVNYSDFLCWFLLYNKQAYDNLVVVTTTDDKATHRLCEYHYVKCVKTDVGIESDGSFNKGKFINAGFDAIKGTDWVMHIDSDIILPPVFRRLINKIKLDQDTLYSIDRLMCKDFKKWVEFVQNPEVQFENGIFVHGNAFPLGVRLASEYYGGWLPIGFTQIFHQGSKKLRYPEEHRSCARGDLQFTLKYPREKRQLIPECLGIHLESGSDKMGVNWNGRKSSFFGFNQPILSPDSPQENTEILPQ